MRIAHEARRTSVVDSPHEPASAQCVLIEAVEAAIVARCRRCIADSRRRMEMNLQIPFILLPGIFPPPVAGGAPRTGSGQHFSAQPLKNDACGTAFVQFEFCGNGRTESPETRGGFETVALSCCRDDAVETAARFGSSQRNQKPPHLKFSRAIGVYQGGRADISFSHHAGDA